MKTRKTTIKEINAMLSLGYIDKVDYKTKKEFKDSTDMNEAWEVICISGELSEPFIREFKDKVNWTYISQYQNLSEPFIREFKDEMDWKRVSNNQKLSESFIREFKDEVDWD